MPALQPCWKLEKSNEPEGETYKKAGLNRCSTVCVKIVFLLLFFILFHFFETFVKKSGSQNALLSMCLICGNMRKAYFSPPGHWDKQTLSWNYYNESLSFKRLKKLSQSKSPPSISNRLLIGGGRAWTPQKKKKKKTPKGLKKPYFSIFWGPSAPRGCL